MQQAKGTARRVAWYATFLCGLTLVAMLVLALINRDTLPMPWLTFALIPFLSFLPVVFFRVAREQQQLENQIRELRDRVEVLEKVTTEHRSTPG
jgi:bacteriorhodopsin